MNEQDQKLRQKILNVLEDNMSNLLFYDRKEDEELPQGAIEDAITRKVVTSEEILDVVKRSMNITEQKQERTASDVEQNLALRVIKYQTLEDALIKAYETGEPERVFEVVEQQLIY